MSILIVEDNKESATILDYNLKFENFETIVTHNAEDALKHLEASKPQIELILLDVMMPTMDGIEFLTLIRNNPDWKDISVLIISANTQPEIIEKAIKLGCKNYLIKPINPVQLIMEVKELLKKDEMAKSPENYQTAQYKLNPDLIMASYGIDRNTCGKLMLDFLNTLQSTITKLEKQIQDKDINISSNELINLKESASIMGARRIVEVIELIDDNSAQNKPSGYKLYYWKMLLKEMGYFHNVLKQSGIPAGK